MPFLPFVYGYPSSCPRAHCTPNKSVPTLRYTRKHNTNHACRHLPSAVPWISEDRLFSMFQFSTVETVITAFIDEFPQFFNSRKRVVIFRISVCVAAFLLGLPMVTQVTRDYNVLFHLGLLMVSQVMRVTVFYPLPFRRGFPGNSFLVRVTYGFRGNA